MHSLLQRQIRKCFPGAAALPEEVQRFAEAIDTAYIQADDDRAMLERSMDLSSKELLERNALLSAAERKYREIFENVAEGIYQSTPQGRYIAVNAAMAGILGYQTAAELKTAITDIGTQVYVSSTRRMEIVLEIEAKGIAREWESEVWHRDGSTRWVVQTVRGILNAQGILQYYEGTFSDVTEKKRAERQRTELQNGMIALSRQAGMAEVATGVLHNVGNVLNSLNVSVTLMTKRLEATKLPSLTRVASMLHERRDNLARFVAEDEKGRKLPALMTMLVEHLLAEHAESAKELASLMANVEHIKQIVMAQQSHAKGGCMIQEVDPASLVDEAIQVNSESLQRHKIQVVRDFETIAPILTDKHQVLQILINLITNAKHAMVKPDVARTLTVHLQRSPADASRLLFRVRDTGVGIPVENLTQIFSHGFTTRSDGHGFGLHTSALAAKSMGGSLHAQSDGLGHGAEFILDLPVRMAGNAPQTRSGT
jgi:PAS domain S-box-containing protein